MREPRRRGRRGARRSPARVCTLRCCPPPHRRARRPQVRKSLKLRGGGSGPAVAMLHFFSWNATRDKVDDVRQGQSFFWRTTEDDLSAMAQVPERGAAEDCAVVWGGGGERGAPGQIPRLCPLVSPPPHATTPHHTPPHPPICSTTTCPRCRCATPCTTCCARAAPASRRGPWPPRTPAACPRAEAALPACCLTVPRLPTAGSRPPSCSPAPPPQWNVSIHGAPSAEGEEGQALRNTQFFWDENHPWDRTGHR